MGINYKENGTIKNIKVKVGDNIPVGAEMDYDGTTIPVGWEEVTPVYGIVESGSNANGSYVKYADGTLICYGTKTDTFTINNSWGALYRELNEKTFQITYPISFVSQPSFNISMNGANSAMLVNWYNSDSVTTKSDRYILARPTSANAQTYSIGWTAIGRWK